MYKFEILVAVVVVMVTISEGRSILQTEETRNPSRIFSNHQYHGNIRGARLQRPSYTSYASRLQPSMINSPWRRLVSRRNGQTVHLNQRQIPKLGRLDHDRQGALLERNMAPTISKPHARSNLVNPSSSRRGLKVNFNINDKNGSRRKTISVNGQHLKNIRFSHSTNNAIVDVHKHDRGTRIAISRRLRRPLAANKSKIADTQLVKDATMQKVNEIVRKTPTGTGNEKSASSVSTHQELTTMRITDAHLFSSLPVEKTTTTNISITNETNTTDSSQFNSTLEQTTLTGSVTKAFDFQSTSISRHAPINDFSITTHAPINDLSTEEPDVTDAPDVDNHVMTGTNSVYWYPFFNALDHD